MSWWGRLLLCHQLCADGGLIVSTPVSAVRARCESSGTRLDGADDPAAIAMSSFIQLDGVVVLTIERAIAQAAVLPIAWQLHEAQLMRALSPLSSMQLWASGFERRARWLARGLAGLSATAGLASGANAYASAGAVALAWAAPALVGGAVSLLLVFARRTLARQLLHWAIRARSRAR